MMATNVFDLFARLLLDTSGYEESLGNARNLAASVGNGIKKGFGALATAAGAAFTAAGAATAKFVSDSVQSGMAFDKSMSQVAATMGYTVDQINDSTSEEAQNFQKLRDFALDMGKSTAFSASQAADALNYMALAGYDAETSMTMLPNVLNLAAAGGIELAAASDMVTDASSALGLDIEHTTLMVDQMAAAASKSNTSVAQLGDAILTVGGTAKGLAGGTTELSTALGLLADNGIKGAEGGTALRNILLSLTPKSEEAAEAMEQIGLKAYDANGNMRPLQDIFTEMSASMKGMSDLERKNILGAMFNKVDLKSVEALLGTDIDRWNELTESIANSENAAENMADTQLDNLAGDITLFKSALEGAEVVISDSLSPTLRGFVNFGTESIGKLTDAFSEGGLEGAIAVLPEILNEGIGMISGILPQAIQVVQEVASALAENLPTIVQSVLPSLLSGLLEVMKSLVKSVPSLLSTVFQTVGQVFGGDTVDSLFQAMQDMLDGVFDAIGQNFTQENVAKVLSWILDLIAHVSDLIGNNIGTIIDVAAQIIDAFVNSFYSPEIVTKIMETATGIITALVEGLTSGDHLQKLLDAALNITLKMQEVFMQPEVLEALTEAGSTIFFELVKGIMQSLPQIANSLAGFCKAIVDFIMNYDWLKAGEGFIDGFVQGFKSIDWSFIDDVEQKWVDFWDSIVAYWSPILEGWTNFWEGYGEYMYDAIHDMLQKWNDFWEGFGEYIYDGVNEAKKRFTDMRTNIVNTLTNIVSSVIERASAIKNTIISRVNDAVSFIRNLPNQAKTWGRDMIQNYVNGITSMVSRAADAARNIAQTIASYIHFSEPDVGPLSDFSTYAPDMIDTFVKGIEGNKNKIGVAMDDALSIGTLDMSPTSSQVSGSAGYSAGQPSTPDAVLDVLRSILTELQKGHQVVLNTDMINRALGQTQVYAERGEVV
jgi:TP901 family phage tail tape measure protein